MNALAQAVSRLLSARAGLALLAALCVGLAISSFIPRLRFDTRFSALLPESTPELVEINALTEKAGGTVELVIAVSGPDEERKLAFSREVVRRLRARSWIRRADVEFPIDFFLDRRLLLMPTADLRTLQEAIDEEIALAKARANPLYVDLEESEDGPRPKPWAGVDSHDSLGRQTLLRRTYTSPDGKYLFIRVKPQGSSFDMSAGKGLLAHIKDDVQAARPERFGVGVRYAGSLELNQEQHEVMSRDLTRAAFLSLGLILLLLTLHARRLFAPIILSVPLVLGVATTLGLTAVTIGQLNLVSGFLVSVLFGLGIDFEIHLYLRYLELLPETPDRRQAMRRSIELVLPGCITAATTTAAAFLAMAVSDFRGFREYGLIAGFGVLITLVMAFAATPALILALTRTGKAIAARPYTGVLRRGPALAMVAVGLGFLVYTAIHTPEVRWYNDFKKLRGDSEKVEFSYWVGDILGGSLSPAALLVDDVRQARQVQEVLRERRRKGGSGVRRHLSLADMVPLDSAGKQPILDALRRSLEKVLDAPLTAEDRRRVQDALKLCRVTPWTQEDIPDAYRRQFLTTDGKQQFVVVWPDFPTQVDHLIIAWGEELSAIQADLAARGLKVQILDENRLGARVLKEMRQDAPMVFAAAAFMVVLLVFLDFRRVFPTLIVTGSLAIGIVWMLGLMALFEIHLNVFNQAVLATIVGVGIDNAVHIRHRYEQEGRGSVAKVVATTGSAAFLAAATTAIGFGTSAIAHHLGVRSLGWLALLGLGCTFIASTIFFPSLMRVLEGRGQGVPSGADPHDR